MMVSLDGYVEGEHHDLSWHNVDEEFNEFAHAQNNHLDTVLFGRRTYDLMAGYWPTPQGNEDRPTADWMTRVRKVVVGRPFEPTWENTEVVSGNLVEAITKIKNEPGTDIAILGSNTLAVSLMEADLVDEFRLMYAPVAIGKGTPLFAGLKKPVGLRLLDSRMFKNGNILLRYAPRR